MGVDGRPLSTRAERFRILLTFSTFAGELPKELSDLGNLTHFDVAGNARQGALSTRAERLTLVLTFPTFLQENCPRNSVNS